jgi:H+/gluconate symporter-like permease
MPFFGTTPFAAPGLGIIASLVMLGFGIWWLQRQEAATKVRGEGFGAGAPKSAEAIAGDETLRERATTAREFDPAEIVHGKASSTCPSFAAAAAPIVVVILVNLVLSLIVLPRLDLSFLSRPEWGGTSPAAVSGVWSVIAALTCAILTVLALNVRRIPDLRSTMDAGVNASALPVISVASLVGFGAVVAALPVFGLVRDAVLGIGGGPLVSLAIATNILAALTGSAFGGLTIALDALGGTFLARAAPIGIDPALLHRVAVISSGTLDSLPHNGAVVTLLSVCGSTHADAYKDVFIVAIVGALIALVVVIVLGSLVGSF